MIVFNLALLLLAGAVFLNALYTYHAMIRPAGPDGSGGCALLRTAALKRVSAITYLSIAYILAELRWISGNLYETTPPIDEAIWILIEGAMLLILYHTCTLLKTAFIGCNVGICQLERRRQRPAQPIRPA